MTTFNTPLRYPGGKAKLAGFIRSIFCENNLMDGQYVETYAGGAGIAFELLFMEFASHIHLNDLDLAVFSFWNAVLTNTEILCRRIRDTPLSIAEWKRQRAIYRARELADRTDLGFAFLFLNRTNRSGILNGGVIGGLNQTGDWKIDARFNRSELIRRIEKIATYRNRISVYNKDAIEFLAEDVAQLPDKTLVYLDPPYFVKGRRLYHTHYRQRDHERIAQVIQQSIKQRWLISYDNVPEILDLYPDRNRAVYSLEYSAARRFIGTEVMFFCDRIGLPDSLPDGMRISVPSSRRRVRYPKRTS